MITPSTGRAEDPRRLCRNQTGAGRIHQQGALLWLLGFFFIYIYTFFILLRDLKRIVLHKNGKGGWKTRIHFQHSSFPHTSGVSSVSRHEVTPSMQLNPRNTDRCCHSDTHRTCSFIRHLPGAGELCFYSSTSRLRSSASNKRWFLKRRGVWYLLCRDSLYHSVEDVCTNSPYNLINL